MADISTYKELNEDEIVVMLDNNIQSSVGYLDGELSEERRRVLDYYNGKLPKAVKGKSRYVSMDVYDAVSSMSASLLETFASGHRIAKFVPTGPEDVDQAEICTNMVDYVCFRQNDLYGHYETGDLRWLDCTCWCCPCLLGANARGRPREL